MKYRIRKLFALTLVLSMLLSMIPLGIAAESLDEFAGYETLDEIPFEFELEPGDLPFEQLKDATLAAEDIPYCIDPAFDSVVLLPAVSLACLVPAAVS